MPFKSRAQQRYMFSAESKGELPKGTAKRWARHTKDIKALPEHVGEKKKASILEAMAAAGDQTAIMIVQVLKSATVGRSEGYGATNGVVTANSKLLSPSTLAKPAVGGFKMPLGGSMVQMGGALPPASAATQLLQPMGMGGNQPSPTSPQPPRLPTSGPHAVTPGGSPPPLPAQPASGTTANLGNSFSSHVASLLPKSMVGPLPLSKNMVMTPPGLPKNKVLPQPTSVNQVVQQTK